MCQLILSLIVGGTKMGGTTRRWYEKPGIRHIDTLKPICKACTGV